MSNLIKFLVLSLCLNTFLFLGVNYGVSTSENFTSDVGGDNLFTLLLDDAGAMEDNLDAYNEGLGSNNSYTSGTSLSPSNISNNPELVYGTSDVSSGVSGISFFADALSTVMVYVRTFFQIAFAPIYLFSSNLMSPLIAILIGLPIMLINIVTLVILLRGGGG